MDGMLKAYSSSNGEYGVIVFSETPGQAKASAANHFDVDFVDVSVKRAKWADEYAGKEIIPKSAYLVAGWWWECECGFPQYEETAIVIDEVVYCEKCKPGVVNK